MFGSWLNHMYGVRDSFICRMYDSFLWEFSTEMAPPPPANVWSSWMLWELVTHAYVECMTHFSYWTHAYVHHDSFIFEAWLIYMCAMTHPYLCHDSLMCVPWRTHVCAMMQPHACHDSFISVPWLVYMCAMIHSHVFHDAFICMPCLVYMCAMTHS